LADATIKAIDDDYDVVMWEKHGVFAVDTDIMSAFDQVDVLNKSALIYIAAKNMGDDMYYRIYIEVAEGEYVYSQRFPYSPKQYCLNALKPTSGASDETKALCVALMNYGAQAQIYFAAQPDSGYTYTKLMNDEAVLHENQYRVEAYSSEMILPLAAKDASKHGVFLPSGLFEGRLNSGAKLGGALSMNLVMTSKVEGYTEAGLLVWREDVYNAVDTLTWENAEVFAASGINGKAFSVSYPGIAAKDVGDSLYCCAYIVIDGEYYYSGLFVNNIQQIALTALKASVGEELKNLYKSIIVYGTYAKKALG
jgi:hypothetical protein